MTAVATADSLLGVVRRHRLLSPEQLAELSPDLLARGPDGRGVAQELLRRGWLTRFQLKHLLLEQGDRLVVGPYLLLEKVGEGGMGQVFKAQQRRVGRVVALKVIRPGSLDAPASVRRFRREAQAASRLAHPNIVAVHDAEQVEGAHLLAMEYVEGTDLSRLVHEQGPLPVGRACDCARQAALGLQHAHDRGIVHRDVKPSNLMVDNRGVVKLLDLGLVRSLPGGVGETASGSLTQAGVVLGTPDFMAPEQARDSSRVDARADLYSLGATLYYLLTAQPPFPGGTAMEKLIRHQTDDPPALESLRPDVPPGLSAVVRRLLEKRAEDRYPTAAAAAAALEPFTSTAAPLTATTVIDPLELSPFAFDELPDGTPLPTVVVPARRRSRPWVALAVAAGSIVLALGLAFALVAHRAEPPKTTEPARPTAVEPVRDRPTPPPTSPATASPLAAPERYLPDETGTVLVLNVPQAVQHPAVARHLGPVRQALRQELGFDPAESVERLTLGVWRDDPRRLVLVVDHAPLPNSFSQRLDRDRAKKKLTLPSGRTETAYQVTWPDSPRPAWLGVLGPTTLAVATDDRDLREAFIKSHGRPTRLQDADLAGLLAGRDTSAAAWLGVSGRQLWVEREPPLRDAAGVHAWRVQARLTDGLEADLEATTDRPETAKRMVEMLMLSVGQQPGFGRLVGRAQPSEKRDGPLTRLRLTSRLTAGELEEAVRNLLSP